MGEGLERKVIRVTDSPPGSGSKAIKSEGSRRKEMLTKDAAERRRSTSDAWKNRHHNDAIRPSQKTSK